MKKQMMTLVVCLAISTIALGHGIIREDAQLVGGTASGPLSLSPFPATIKMKNWCTGVKVGAKSFLTAAHCVFNFSAKTKLATFNDGQSLEVTNAPNPYDGLPLWTPLTIETTIIDPGFLAACAATGCDYVSATDGGQDLALVRVMEETPLISIASVDYRFMLPGDQIDIMGYGCEMGSGPLAPPGVPGVPNLSNGRLKYQSTKVARDDVPELVGVPGGSAAHLVNFYSAGLPTDSTSASTCPGVPLARYFSTVLTPWSV